MKLIYIYSVYFLKILIVVINNKTHINNNHNFMKYAIFMYTKYIIATL